jgi:hypothetical protein
MTYSCADFVDSVVDALKVTIPVEHADSPSSQADIVLSEIERLQRAARPARKVRVWTLASTVPGEAEPCIPHVCAAEAEANAQAEQCLKDEWETNGPEDEATGERLPYPGNWQAAQDAIIEERRGSDGELWGQYEITSHEIEVQGFTPREHATILAALRYWQRNALQADQPNPEDDIATCGGTLAIMHPTEIDALCEEINRP